MPQATAERGLLEVIIAESGGEDKLAAGAAAAPGYHGRSRHIALNGQGHLSRQVSSVGTRQQFHHLPGTNTRVFHLVPTEGPT